MKKNENLNSSNNSENEINVPDIYANIIQTNFSPYEIEIQFGIKDVNADQAKSSLKVRLSPQLAKEFAESMQKVIKTYESKIGAIPSLK